MWLFFLLLLLVWVALCLVLGAGRLRHATLRIVVLAVALKQVAETSKHRDLIAVSAQSLSSLDKKPMQRMSGCEWSDFDHEASSGEDPDRAYCGVCCYRQPVLADVCVSGAAGGAAAFGPLAPTLAYCQKHALCILRSMSRQ